MPMIFTADSVKSELMKANRDYYGKNVWNTAFNTVAANQDASTAQLNEQYGSLVSQAYLSAFANEQAIGTGSVGQGYKALALNQNKDSLESAFENYKANYLNSKAEIDKNAQEYASQIDYALNSQSKNVADYANSAFDYISWLYENNSELFKDNALFARYLDYDEEGNEIGLSNLREYMFDDEELNESGIDFLNFVQNYNASDDMPNGTSFSDYLYENNPALLEWLSSTDPYSSGGTNRDTFNKLLGLSSEVYNPSSARFNDTQWSNLTGTYTRSHDELLDQYKKGHRSEGDATTFMEKQREETERLLSLAEHLGVYDEVKDLADKVKTNLDTYDDTVKNPGKGNNRKNREWATSSALADYEELYEAVMKANGSYGFENATSRIIPNYQNLYETGRIDEEAYNRYLDTDIDLSESKLTGIFGNKLSLTYNTKGRGKESILLSPDYYNEVYLDDGTFNEIQQFDKTGATYTLGTSSNGDLLVRFSKDGEYKYYKIDDSKLTSDDKQVVSYLKRQK